MVGMMRCDWALTVGNIIKIYTYRFKHCPQNWTDRYVTMLFRTDNTNGKSISSVSCNTVFYQVLLIFQQQVLLGGIVSLPFISRYSM